MQITRTAPAKINLGLEVLNKREDGFHNINTIFYRTSLCDIITFELADQFELVCTPDLGIDYKDNLIYKAFQLLQDKYKFKENIKITLEKNIPSGAGLGGGSSDAAISLLAINDLLQLDCPYEQLHTFASKLGSDVPFFLKNQPAEALSRGEVLNYFEYTLPYYIVLINPNIHISTPWAYKSLSRTQESKKQTDFKEILFKHPEQWKNIIINDFENTVFQQHPQISDIKQKLYDMGASFALMSGSGSTVFGLFQEKDLAEDAIRHFSKYMTFLCVPSSTDD